MAMRIMPRITVVRANRPTITAVQPKRWHLVKVDISLLKVLKVRDGGIMPYSELNVKPGGLLDQVSVDEETDR